MIEVQNSPRAIQAWFENHSGSHLCDACPLYGTDGCVSRKALTIKMPSRTSCAEAVIRYFRNSRTKIAGFVEAQV